MTARVIVTHGCFLDFSYCAAVGPAPTPEDVTDLASTRPYDGMDRLRDEMNSANVWKMREAFLKFPQSTCMKEQTFVSAECGGRRQ